MDYDALKPFCQTERQQQILDACSSEGSTRKAAKKLGINKRNVSFAIHRIKSNAVKHGYSPEHNMQNPVADGFKLARHSQYYDKDGNPTNRWVIAVPDKERQAELMREAVSALCEDIPKSTAVKLKSKQSNPNLINQYTITDYHLGMLSWPDETGDDWNSDIAENMLVNWFSRAITHSPSTENAIFAQIGDFMHWDGLDAVTPTNRHVLDADTRFQHIVRIAIRALRRVTEMLLEKHKHVHIIMADANHDPASGVWLREMFSAFYAAEPRITVDNSADSYYCYEYGLVSLFYHHGHKRNPENIDTVLTSKFRDVFGRTKYSYAHMGHMHHKKALETNLMVVEQHRTLSAKDAYASRGGYMSGRDAQVITYHKNYGEVSRLTITPEMLK